MATRDYKTNVSIDRRPVGIYSRSIDQPGAAGDDILLELQPGTRILDAYLNEEAAVTGNVAMKGRLTGGTVATPADQVIITAAAITNKLSIDATGHVKCVNKGNLVLEWAQSGSGTIQAFVMVADEP